MSNIYDGAFLRKAPLLDVGEGPKYFFVNRFQMRIQITVNQLTWSFLGKS